MKDDDQEQEQEKEFTIVEYTDARLPSDPAIRNVIRRHAMRNVAETRRQRDNYGRHSPKNPPTLTFEAIPKASSSTQPSSSEAVSAGHVDAPAKAIAPITWKYLAGPTAPLPMSTPEATIAENFAILHLVESLSGLHLGVNAQASSIPRLGLHKLQLPQSKTLLSFIPSRYGHVTPLTCAVDCLVARVRQITLKDDGFSEDRCLEVLHLYDKALKALQEAINDDEERKTPETLCAAELLGFFELLDGKSRAAHSWTRHAAGVAQLIQHQGADHFRTDFELALIAAYVGPLGPNLFKKVAQMVLSQNPVPPEAIQSVEEGLMADLQEIHGWLGMEYDIHNTNDPPQGTNGNFLTWHINFRQSIVSL
ncbi:uncharacterized protein TRIVIDRAFT_198604 [Trichoderma virens Gv29-8]|uniref:Uncharacterized protein n=1 Tax=Hypocrea virens (strain Gv29-8 / FGSC 10586) TaxID=413071 RepID=G9MJJ4_HYPVG|nr:uncharacterized protein TRIVIDRAFT_198604 [Trichoderma virens Gv29-8]EHK25657.1 hypothetical protein TRIVIDRAFT_198604 [Trichoderma virens Gv29-8]